MLTFLNKIRQNLSRCLSFEREDRSSPSYKNKGQVAIILIVIIAICLVFFAIALNLGRIAQSKTMTMMAANQASILMASEMASLSEYMYQVSLGGPSNTDNELSVCGWTGVAAAFLTIVALVVSIFTLQPSPLIIVAAAVLAVANVLLQALVIQPGLTDLWNKQIQKLDQADQFLQRGLITALQSSVDDNVLLNDTIDMDGDGLYDVNSPGEQVNRFAYHFTEYLNWAIPKRYVVDEEVVRAFQHSLGKFLFRAYTSKLNGITITEDDGWGIWDPVGYACFSNPSHPCCTNPIGVGCLVCGRVIESSPTGPLASPPIDPCCDTTEARNFRECEKCTVTPTQPCCIEANRPSECNPCCLPKGDCRRQDGSVCVQPPPPLPEDPACHCEPNVRPYCCDLPDDNPEKCGTATTCPATRFPWVFDPNYEDTTNTFVSLREVIGQDDVNRYVPEPPLPPYKFRPQDATGVFTYFWAVSKAKLPAPGNDCFWCDRNVGSAGGETCTAENTGLILPAACTNQPECCLPDNYDRVVALPNFLIDENACMQRSTNPPGIWKKGSTHQCSAVWPYDYNCPGQYCDAPNACWYCDNNASGSCLIEPEHVPSPDPNDPTVRCDYPRPGFGSAYWPEDFVDDFRYGMDEFIGWANKIVHTDPKELAMSLTQWYPELDRWINLNVDYSTGAPIYGGQLKKWLDGMTLLRNKIKAWRESNLYGGTLDTDVCYPADPDGTRQPATIPQIIDCLKIKIEEAEASGDDTLAAKYKYRMDYLNYLYLASGRIVDELTKAIDAPGIYSFTKFLDQLPGTPLANLKRQYELLQNPAPGQAISNQITYAWKSLPANTPLSGNDDDVRKYWHIVRVEAELPGRCNFECGRERGRGRDGRIHEPNWPYLKTYTKDWGTRRCWSMGDNFDNYADGFPSAGSPAGECNNTYAYTHRPDYCFKGGKVRARVTRYDEDKDLTLKFPLGSPIWRFMYHNPKAPLTAQETKNLLDGMSAACGNNLESFIIPGSATSTQTCINAVTALLNHGVSSTSCAEYFWHKGDFVGFGVRFTPAGASCKMGLRE